MAALIDIVKKGSTDRSVTIRIIDSTDGTPETGVVFNTSGIDLWYRREGATKTSITEADLTTPALDDAHADGGFLHISDGEYRLDLPDAAFATGANHVDVGGTVTGMIVIGGRVRLVDYDPEDSVRMGMTALPNAAADAAGGLPISDAGGLDLDGLNTNVSSILTDTGTTLPATLATAQADLDTITGSDGVTIASTQGAISFGAITVSVTGSTNNITLAGSGTGDGLVFTRSGSGGLFGTNWAAAIQQEATDALNAYDPPTNTEMTAAFTEIKGATWSSATDTLEAIRDRGDAAWITATGFSTHSAADVWAAATRTLTANTNLNDPTAAAIATAVLTTQMTESYAVDGAAPTLAQGIFQIQQFLHESSVSGTTVTVKGLDGSTSKFTLTLNDATTPTSITRAT